jgi:outer membrane protein assembly factor BamB
MVDEQHKSDGESYSASDQPYSEPTAVASTVSDAKGGIRWWLAGLILAATAIGYVAALQWAGDDLSKQSLATVIPWFLGSMVMVLWWILLSGARWGTRFKGVGLLLTCFALFVGLFRWNGQAGNFVPQFALRFGPTAEERAVEYFDKAKDSSAVVSDSPGALEVTANDWPRFGGANEDHIVTDAPIRRDWNENPPSELWRHPIGPGWSSFSVVGDLLFTQEQRGELEAVVCYDASTGEQIWLHTDEARFYDPASGTGPRSTPTIHDSRLYALGGTGILNCLDPVTGTRHWSTNIVEDADTSLIEWGMAGAPLIYDETVIVNPGGKTGSVAAYDRITGDKLWAGAGDQATYASPQVAELNGVPQILIFCSTGLCGHDVTTGERLWAFPWTNMTKLNIVQPIVLPDNSVFISSGYGGGSARLDITKRDDGWKVEPQWTAPDRFRLKFNGGIYRDGFVYGLDEGILACFDVANGKRTWKRGRYNFGQIVMVGDDLVVVTESGKIVLVEVTPTKAQEVGSFQAIEGKTWNHPVVNRGRLYVRNGEEVACYDLSL